MNSYNKETARVAADVTATINSQREQIENHLKRKILQTCEEKGLFLHKASIDDSFDLYQSGVLDSFDLYEFLITLEQELNVEIVMSELEPRSLTVFGKLVQVLLDSDVQENETG